MSRSCRTVRCMFFLSVVGLLANVVLMPELESELPQTPTTSTPSTTITVSPTKKKTPLMQLKNPNLADALSQAVASSSPSNPTTTVPIEDTNTPQFPEKPSTTSTIQRTMRFGKHWRPLPDDEFKIPFPVFLASLPKTGTTSVHSYFRCGRVRSVHTYCPKKDPSDGGMARLGVLMEDNVKQGLPPFQGCGTNNSSDVRGPPKVFTDVGYVLPDGPCYYPSVSALDALYQAYPNMTLMLSIRNGTSWYQSLRDWHGGYFVQRLIQFCDFIPRNNTLEAFVNFYNAHNDHVRQFAKQHPSITYVEFALESPTVGEYLEQTTGIPSSCWANHLPRKKSSKELSNTRMKRRKEKRKAAN